MSVKQKFYDICICICHSCRVFLCWMCKFCRFVVNKRMCKHFMLYALSPVASHKHCYSAQGWSHVLPRVKQVVSHKSFKRIQLTPDVIMTWTTECRFDVMLTSFLCHAFAVLNFTLTTSWLDVKFLWRYYKIKVFGPNWKTQHGNWLVGTAHGHKIFWNGAVLFLNWINCTSGSKTFIRTVLFPTPNNTRVMHRWQSWHLDL